MSGVGEAALAPAPRWVLPPRVALLAATGCAAITVAWVALDIGWVIGIALTLAAVVVTVLAAVSAARFRSRFVAPLAVVIVALVNPLSLAGLAEVSRTNFGVVGFAFDRGPVLWATYPGIAGWEAPADVEEVPTAGLKRQADAAVRGIVDATSAAHGWSWSIAEQAPSRPIANGYGGTSVFERVDTVEWASTDFDGSPAQRATLLAAVDATAEALGLAEADAVEGDVAEGDGVRVYAAPNAELTLRIDGGEVSVVYRAGPFLAVSSSEYELRLAPFEGLTPPAPIEEPALP